MEIKDIGDFGKPHIDQRDAVITWSTVTACPRLPQGYTAGEFHLLQLGFYISLSPDGVTSFSFSGLELHGASPPRSPPGIKPSATAVRVLTVAYAGDVLFNGDGVFPFATNPHGDLIWIGPEERDAGYAPLSLPASSSHIFYSRGYNIDRRRAANLNFVDDSPGLMEPGHVTEFVIKNLYLKSLHAIESLPLAPRLDPDKFFAAFSIEEENIRKPFPSWPNAPHLTPAQPGYAGQLFAHCAVREVMCF